MKTGPYTVTDYDTRHKRRDSVKSILACLSAIREAEQKSLDNVPDNLQSSDNFVSGEYAVDALDEIIDLLSEVY